MPSPSVDELLASAVKAVPGGTKRDGQLAMATAVGDAIHSNEHLLVQAGTGTGKSLAYLVPALHSGKRAVISTATLALQAQLVDHDLPRLLDALEPKLGRRPEYALLKGRHHYACLAKLETATADSLFEDGPQWVGEVGKIGKQIVRIREWADRTESGDRTELDPGVDDLVWRQVSMPARECVGAARCPFGDGCFAEGSRAKAREADVIVTNHSLLAIDMLQDRQILPPHAVLVVDEAHELAAHVTSSAQAQVNTDGIHRVMRRAGRLIGADIRQRLEEAEDALAIALDAAPLGRIQPVPPQLSEALTLLDGSINKAVDSIGSINADDGDVVGKNQSKQALRDVVDTVARLRSESEHDVIWIDEDDRGRRSLVVAPLSVAGLLGTWLFADRAVILTSATLTPGGRFDIVARSFGLPPEAIKPDRPENGTQLSPKVAGSDMPLRWRGMDVGSPFDYGRQGILYVAAHLPRPGPSGLPEATQQELIELVEAAGGRTLGLFSSRKAAAQAAETVRAKTKFPILLQGEDSLSNLVRRFRDDPATCLFGVMSLWQGVDVPGQACQLVVVDRLPFPRPDEPLAAARAKAVDDAGGSGFFSVSVPHAAIRLAQGAGRLIRGINDRGVVAVLDSRLHHARYGSFIRSSLPAFWYTTSPDVARGALSRLVTVSDEVNGAVDPL